MTPDKVEEWVEYCAEICDNVEFLHGVPVQLPSQTKALLRGRVREALTQYHQDLKKTIESHRKEIGATEGLKPNGHHTTAVHRKIKYNNAIDDIIKSISKDQLTK